MPACQWALRIVFNPFDYLAISQSRRLNIENEYEWICIVGAGGQEDGGMNEDGEKAPHAYTTGADRFDNG